MSDTHWMGPLSNNPSALKREAVKRRKPQEEISVPTLLVDDHLANGWIIDRELKTKTRLRRSFSHDQRLENQVWMLFYLLGYPEISSGRSFTVTIQRKNAEPFKKQIDVLAKDDETVIVAECKSSADLSRRSLQKDIEEFANLKGPISNAIKKHYGVGFKPKILWMFITNNIAWSHPDRQRASGANIHVITERELSYYSQIAHHLRAAARFQFLAEFLKGQKLPEMENKTIPAIKGRMGGKTFYSFVSTPRQMLKIAFINHRSLNDPTGAPAYQRLVTRSRLRQISAFIGEGGFFPTNILVNFVKRCRFDLVSKDLDAGVTVGSLYLPNTYQSAWVIDGQHRLYGYAPLPDSFLDHNIMVVGFEQLQKEEEANLFVTINHEQKSVPKTLLDDLEGELKWGSDVPRERIGAIAARVVGALNSDVGEPFYRRVTQQGIAPTEFTCLTVPALKLGLRQSGLLGKPILKNKEFDPGPLSGVDDAETLDRARSSLNLYFNLLSSANPKHWRDGRKGVLCTNVSTQAYLKLLNSLIDYMEANKGLAPRELTPAELVSEIEEYMMPVLTLLEESAAPDLERRFRVPFGSGGPREYFYRLCVIIREVYSDFAPDGLKEWTEEQSEERINRADSKLKDLNIRVQKIIFDRLKAEHGLEDYFEKGVPDKVIKISAHEKSQDVELEERLPLENYLDFIQYKKIVEKKPNWNVFKDLFDIPEVGNKGKVKNLHWMDRVNELRRIPAHPTEERRYKLDDLDYIDWIHDEFMSRLNNALTVVR